MAWSTTGTRVKISKVPASTILFSRNGSTTIRQVEVAETAEIRGLTETAANDLCGITENTTQASYYAKIDGDVYTFTATTGTRTEVSGARRDDSGQWVVTERKTTFSVTPSPLPQGWGTTPLNERGEAITLSASGTSYDVTIDFSSSRLWTYGGHPVNQTIKAVISEIRYVATKAAADALVVANTTNTVGDTTLKHDVLYTLQSGAVAVATLAWCTVKTGTEKFASARYVSEKEGWCVNVTTKTYGYSATMTYAGSENGWHL